MFRQTGSSPHTWGTHTGAINEWMGSRFIPTYVGNTKADCSVFEKRAVHPHIRGEHVFAVHHLHKIQGSSPHTWGTLHEHLFPLEIDRFIPTYVGNTPPGQCHTLPLTVHPHIRGEHSI